MKGQEIGISTVIAVVILIIILILIVVFAIIPSMRAGVNLHPQSCNLTCFTNLCQTYCATASNYNIPSNEWCIATTTYGGKTLHCWNITSNCTFYSSNGSKRIANITTCTGSSPSSINLPPYPSPNPLPPPGPIGI